jgi:outer membrane biosynthesis protein TonB
LNYFKGEAQNCEHIMRFAMRRLSLSFVSSILAFSAACGVAHALPASEVTAMLAKSQALDARCSILSETDRQDLMDFLARAEILLAERESVSAAKAALSKGKAQGANGACGPEETKFVNDVLAAAKAGSANEDAIQQAEEPTPVEPQSPAQIEAQKPVEQPKQVVVEKPVQKPKLVEAKPVKKKPETVAVTTVTKKAKTKPAILAEAKKQKKTPALSAYSGLAQRYYTELKCRNMSGSAVKRLYANVLSSHKKALADSGASAVRTTLRNAEAKANASRCT